MKSINKPKRKTSAQAGVVSFFVGAMIAVVIALQVVWPVLDDIIYDASSASGTLTLSGNVSCNELVNVTNVAGVRATFEFNITGANCAAANTVWDTVTLGINQNTSTIAATNLTTSMNANGTISGTMTAANPSAGVVTLIYNTAGTTGNTVATTETLSAGAWGGTTLSGGTNTVTNNMSASSQTLVNLIPLFLVLLVLMIFIRPLL